MLIAGKHSAVHQLEQKLLRLVCLSGQPNGGRLLCEQAPIEQPSHNTISHQHTPMLINGT